MDSKTHLRVAARYQSVLATEILKRDFGRFMMLYLPRHAAYVDDIGAKLLDAMSRVEGAGIPLPQNLQCLLGGKGLAHADAAYWEHSSPPTMAVAPKAYKDPKLVATLIHELGHCVHDKVIPGGMRNIEVLRRRSWAARHHRHTSGGEAPKIDVLRAKRRQLGQIMKVLEEKKYLRKPLPRKGQEFQYDRWVSGVLYHLTGKIIGKGSRSGSVRIELINPPEKTLNWLVGPYRKSPPFIVDDTVHSLTYAGVDPDIEERLKAAEKEDGALFDQINALARTTEDDRYETVANHWFPTTYSRKNEREWIAELVTTYVHGTLKGEPAEWLLSVIRTGKAPEGFPDADT